jgi:hypothetical protein
MKLRNKKTGGLANIMGEQDFFRVYTDAGWADYNSLAELNEEWEDYKPAEPLIKDEKVRKAVRAWAEACDVEKCHYDGDGDFATRWHGIKLDGSQIELNEGHYTIDELCGEEKA